jgi:thiamine pyrophosphate-dependent acetolactate synthase large subunit-like protein
MGRTDWEEMAKGAGYAAVFNFDNLEDLTTSIDQVLATTGPVFIRLAITPEIENTAVQFRTRPSRSVLTAFKELPEALAKG